MRTAGKYNKIIAGIILFLLLCSLIILVRNRDSFSPPSPDAPPAGTPVAIRGTVAAYGSNPDKDIDKLLIETGNGNYCVHFPPNAAQEVLSVAAKNAGIEVQVTRAEHSSPDGITQQELLSVINTRTGKTVSVRNVAPPPPSGGKEVEISGAITGFQTNKNDNRIRGILINKNLVLLPPHTTESLLPLLAKNKIIQVKGHERSPHSGFVNEDSLAVIRPYQFTIDGVQYVIQ